MKTTQNKTVGHEIVDAVTDRSVIYKKVKIRYAQWWKRLFVFLRLLPNTKDIVLTELFPATVYRLFGILIDLRVKGDEGDSQELSVYKILHSNLPLLKRFIAVGIHNKIDEPPQWLLDAIDYQFTNEDLDFLVTDIYRRLDVETFFGIMASLRQVQEMSSHTLDLTVPTPS